MLATSGNESTRLGDTLVVAATRGAVTGRFVAVGSGRFVSNGDDTAVGEIDAAGGGGSAAVTATSDADG